MTKDFNRFRRGGSLAIAAFALLLASTWASARLLQTPLQIGGEAGSLLTDGRILLTGGVLRGTLVPQGRIIGAHESGASLGDGWRSRTEHTSTLLPGGSLLVVGGLTDQGASEEALLIRPSLSATDAIAGVLGVARSGHTTTLLLDGRALVVGGDDGNQDALSSIEVFDPRAGQPSADVPYEPRLGIFLPWSTRLSVARSQHTATMLPSGELLIVGGRDGSEDLGSAELIDPATGSVRRLESGLVTPRSEHSATLLPDGRVLVAGGRSRGRLLASVEYFDPESTRFTVGRERLAASRANHVAALVSETEVVLSGGGVDADERFELRGGPAEPPSLVAVTPVADTTDAGLYSLIGARLSRPLPAGALVTTTGLTTSQTPVSGKAIVAESGLYAFFVADGPLEPGTWYRARVVSRREADRRPILDAAWSFRTLDTQEPEGPSASGSTPDGPNTAPVVNVGPDLKRTLPARAMLTATVTDDGLPIPPGAVTLTWSKVSGPGTVTFTNASSASTAAIINLPGSYTLRLTAFDGALSASDDLVLDVTSRSQFVGDAIPDLLWQHRSLGNLVAWQMSNIGGVPPTPPTYTKVGSSLSPTPNTVADGNQKIVGLADFNQDGKSDFLFQNQYTGLLYAWYMNGLIRIGSELMPSPQQMPNNDPEWMVVATPDINNDGRADLLLQHQTTGVLEVWFMNGLTRTSTGSPSPNQPSSDYANWKVIAAEDFNGDGKADFLWQNRLNSFLVVWYMDGLTRTGTGSPVPGQASSDQANWQVVATGDYNLDGSVDLLWQHRIDGWMVVWYMNGITRWGNSSPNPSRAASDYENWPVVGNFAWKRGVLPISLTPPSGSYASAVNVTLTVYPNSGRYTLDTTAPTEFSSFYFQPLLVDQGKTVKAKSIWPGWVSSVTAQATYTLQVATPKLSLASGTYPYNEEVFVSCATLGAVIHYTTNGSVPTEADPTISSGSSLKLDRNMTLRAKAWKSGATPSADVSATYIVTGAKSALFIVGNTSDPLDLAVRDRLVSLGFTVTLQDDDTAQTTQAGNKSVVVISSGVNSGLANLIAFSTVTTPIVTYEALLWDDFKMSSTVVNTDYDAQTTVNIVVPEHPAAGNKNGVTTIYSPTAGGVFWATPAASATIFARRNETFPRPAFFAYERGALLVGNEIARGRRVATINPKGSVTPDGWALFDAAVLWGSQINYPKVRFIAGAGPLSTDDKLAIDRISGLGFNVFAQSGNLALGDEVGMAALVISSTMSDSTGINWAQIRGVTTPVVLWQHTLYDDFNLAVARGSTGGQSQVRIASTAHPLNAGLAPGLVAVTTSAKPFGWCQVSASAVGAAEIASVATNKTVFGYEYNAGLPGGGTAADRRVGLFMTDLNTVPGTFQSLNANGWRLFENAINWATSGDVDGDGLSAKEESRWGTNPRMADTNGNGVLDGAEVAMGKDPTLPDSDGDGWLNAFELTKGTNPFDPDTDHDGYNDPVDAFPLDPTRWLPPTDPTPNAPPTITLTAPFGAVLTSTVCTPNPCP